VSSKWVWLYYALAGKYSTCGIDEALISEEFGLKVMSLKDSDSSHWNPVAAFQVEVLS